MRSFQWAVVLPVTAFLLFCGCGNSTKAPTSLHYTTATASYPRQVAITPNSPSSSGGAPTSYSVSPALPAGLSMNTGSGVISGTPTVVAAAVSYTVAASNSAGNAVANVVITVTDLPPAALTYSPGSAVYTRGISIAPNTPASKGGVIMTYAVSPALPPGLSLSPASGIIAGNPTTVTAAANYTVTASNASGTTTTVLAFTVKDQPPLAQQIPNLGIQITPTAPVDSRFQPLVPGLAQYPAWQAGQAVSTVVSPDGNTLLILTSGFNRLYLPAGSPANPDTTSFDYANSKEYIFVFDISKGIPIQKQVLTVPNSYNGIVFDPTIDTNKADTNYGKSTAFYVSSGPGDYPFADGISSTPAFANVGGDNIHVFTLSANGTTWSHSQELALGHTGAIGILAANVGPTPVNQILFVPPCAAGLGISDDGQTLVVANYDNDSITVFTGGLGNWVKLKDLDLRPGDGTATTMGTAGGEYPFWVDIQGTGASTTAYISSMRDREIVVANLSGAPTVTGRVPVVGQPTKMTMNKLRTRLYVAEDLSDTVDVIDITKGSATTGAAAILETIPVVAPASVLSAYPLIQTQKGANTNNVTLSPDESQLYVVNGNLNAIAVVQLTGTDKNDQVIGLIPTGWYPNSVSFGPTINSSNGNWVYVVNGKSPTGPNAGFCYSSGPATHTGCYPAEQYNPQHVKAGFQSFPQPTTAALSTLTAQVAVNNHFSATESSSDAAVMAAVRAGVQHVIFIIKENRSYDQVLGDLEIGNGDPNLTEFPEALTPNLHNLARSFVTLDNIMTSAEVSNDGWPWTTSALAPDVVEKQYLLAYGNRAFTLETEGNNRNINVAIPTLAGRIDADPLTPADGNALAGTADNDAPDGPDNVLDKGQGFIWDAAIRAGLSVRNYGFFLDTTLYACLQPSACISPTLTMPFTSKTVVAHPASVSLTNFTDLYYRGFDNAFPDYYRFQEWSRDFDANFATGGLPNLSLVRLMHDHTGNFNDPAGYGLNTPELQQSDNDYAVGLLIEKISHSIYAQNTLVFIIEDDSQDAGDHVDSHRTVAFVAGAYVKQQALVSAPYTTLNFLRTIEEVLGLPQMNLNDTRSRPMADIFNTSPSPWTFTPTVPAGLLAPTVKLPLSRMPGSIAPKSTHDSKYWERATRGMDFTTEDKMDFNLYNHILWTGLMGNKPYPEKPSRLDLRHNRKELLANYRRSQR